MKITTKGQDTVPRNIRERLGLLPHTPVEWELRDGVAVLKKVDEDGGHRGRDLIARLRGRGTVTMSTDEIMRLTRDGS